jgi:hypothetical protein
MRLAILAVMVLLGFGDGAQAANKPGSGMTDAKCQATWITISPNGATITEDKLAAYAADFITFDTDNDGTIDANEFMAGCKGGLIK